MDCNDDKPRHACATPRRDAPEPLMNLSPKKTEGVGNAGCPLHPPPRHVTECPTVSHSECKKPLRHRPNPLVMGL